MFQELRETSWKKHKVVTYLVNADHIFWVWIAVYCLQMVWILSGIALIFQKTTRGRHLYVRVTLLPWSVHVCMMLAAAAILGWVLLWSKWDYMLESVSCVAGAALFSYAALLCSMLACRNAEPWLVLQDKTGVLILVGLFIQNGLAAFATMCCILTNYHLSIILSVEGNVSLTVCCYVSFGLLLVYVGVYFIIDTCLSDRHAQCVVTPYILVCLSYVSAYFTITGQSEADKLHLTDYNLVWILALVGAGASGVMLLVKVIVSLWRAHTRKSHDRQEREKHRHANPNKV